MSDSSTPDTLADLAGLAAHADATATQAGGLPPPAGGEPAPGVPATTEYATEAAAMVDLFATMVGGFSATAGALWTVEKRQVVAAALAPVLQKYGLSLGGIPPELALLIAAGPLLWQTSQIIGVEMARAKAKAAADKARTVDAEPQAKARAPAPAPNGSPETPTHPQTALYP